jgi:hypothetical protein
MRPIPKLTTMRAMRAFHLEGRIVPPGEVVDIVGELALILERSGRALRVEATTDNPKKDDHDRLLFA